MSKIGTLNGQDVYYSGSNGWLIRSKNSSVLLDMTKEQIGRFMTQPLQFLRAN